MVKFEFVLNDVDASNLISILHDEKVRALVKAQEFIKPQMSKVDRANMDKVPGPQLALRYLGGAPASSARSRKAWTSQLTAWRTRQG